MDADAIRMLMGNGGMFGNPNPWSPQMPGLNGLFPGMSGPMGAAFGMMAYPFLMQMGGGTGMLGLQMSGQQNLYDTMAAQQMMQERTLALSMSAQADRTQAMRMARGWSNITDGQFTAGHQAAAGRLADTLGSMAPFLSTAMPEMWDKLYGSRGSAVVMAHGVFEGGRFGTDPVSGTMGMTGESAGYMSRRLYEEMYGGDNYLLQNRGMSAGQMGSMYNELQRRGFMGGADDLTKRMGAEGGLIGETSARESEVMRLKDRLQEMSKAVSAMKDIFGDAGNPDAPMPALINGLQALTQGGLSAMDPAKLESTLRQTQQLARASGIGLGGVLQMMATGAGYADQLGLDRQFAVGATQQAIGYGIAARNNGFGAMTGYGVMSAEGMMAADQKLRMSAAASPLANQFNAIMAARDLFMRDPEMASTEFGQLAEAISKEQMTYNGGKSVVMSSAALLDIAEKSGVSRAGLAGLLYNPEATKSYGLTNPTGALSRRFQWDTDIAPRLSNYVLRAASTAGITGAEGEAFTDRAISKMMSVDPTAWQGAGRIDAIIDAMGPLPAGVTREQAVLALSTSMSGFEQMSVTAGTGNWNQIYQLHNPKMAAAQRDVNIVMAARGDVSSALSPLGRGGILRNLTDYIASAPTDPSLLDFGMKVFGGKMPAEVLEALHAAGGSDYIKRFAAASAITDPEERRAALKALGPGLEQMGSVLERGLTAAGKKAIDTWAAGDDDRVIAAAGQSGFRSESLKKALNRADPEERRKFYSAAQTASASVWDANMSPEEIEAAMSFDAYKSTGDERSFLKRHFGERGVASGMGTQTVKIDGEVPVVLGRAAEIIGRLVVGFDGIGALIGSLSRHTVGNGGVGPGQHGPPAPAGVG